MEARGALVSRVRDGGRTTDYTDYTDEDATPHPDCGFPLIMSKNRELLDSPIRRSRMEFNRVFGLFSS